MKSFFADFLETSDGKLTADAETIDVELQKAWSPVFNRKQCPERKENFKRLFGECMKTAQGRIQANYKEDPESDCVTAEALKAAAGRLSATSAGGPGGWRAVELKALPLEAWAQNIGFTVGN